MIEVEILGNNLVNVNGVTYRHRTPICHAARVLAEAGNNGLAVATRQGQHVLYFDIIQTAKLTVLENESHGPRFAKYRKFDNSVFGNEMELT